MRVVAIFMLLALSSLPATASAAPARTEHGVRIHYGQQAASPEDVSETVIAVAIDPGYGGTTLKQRHLLGAPHGTAVSRRIMRLRQARTDASATANATQSRD